MTLFCIVAPQHTYRGWLTVAAENLLRNTTTKINQLILNFLMVNITAQKMKFSIKDFFSKCDQNLVTFTEDLVTFTEEILNGKLHFLCSDNQEW